MLARIIRLLRAIVFVVRGLYKRFLTFLSVSDGEVLRRWILELVFVLAALVTIIAYFQA